MLKVNGHASSLCFAWNCLAEPFLSSRLTLPLCTCRASGNPSKLTTPTTREFGCTLRSITLNTALIPPFTSLTTLPCLVWICGRWETGWLLLSHVSFAVTAGPTVQLWHFFRWNLAPSLITSWSQMMWRKQRTSEMKHGVWQRYVRNSFFYRSCFMCAACLCFANANLFTL